MKEALKPENQKPKLQVACASDAAYNFRMCEFWILEKERQSHGTLWHCCAPDGEERRWQAFQKRFRV